VQGCHVFKTREGKMISSDMRLILDDEFFTALEWNQFFFEMTEAMGRGLDEESAALLALRIVKPSELQ
jgi:hypothetical protein